MTATDTRLASPRLVAEGAAVVARFADPDDQARIALAWAHDTFGNDLVLASSMGDEVLVHLASEVIPEVNTLFIDTGYHFAETLGTAAAYDAVRPITLITVTPAADRGRAGRRRGCGPLRPRPRPLLRAAQGRAARARPGARTRRGSPGCAASTPRPAPTSR